MFQFRTRRIAPFLLVFGAASLLFAGCHGHRHGGDPHKKADKIADKLKGKLELSDSQDAKIRKIAHEVADRASEFRGLHREVHREALMQLRAASVDEAAMNRVAEEQEAKFKELRAFLVQKFAEAHLVLTPDQREKLATYLEKRGKKMRKHRD
jgi:Spy/CpxP family protein refolding chaperone